MNQKYALLKSSALNLGDEIQSYILRPYLPRVDFYIDGELLGDFRVGGDTEVRMVIHGCMNSSWSNSWPPGQGINPLITSLHIGDYAKEKFLTSNSLDYLEAHSPVGCRDLATLDLLQSRGIDSYFSGCISFMLEPNKEERSGAIVLSDLDSEAVEALPKSLLPKCKVVAHGGGIPIESIAGRLQRLSPPLYKLVKSTRIHILVVGYLQRGLVRRVQNPERRLEEAGQLLDTLTQAKLVITSRLHGALPCLALGTPVILVHRGLEGPRFSGLVDYMNAYTVKDFGSKASTIDFDNPKPNPKSVESLGRSLRGICESYFMKGAELNED